MENVIYVLNDNLWKEESTQGSNGQLVLKKYKPVCIASCMYTYQGYSFCKVEFYKKTKWNVSVLSNLSHRQMEKASALCIQVSLLSLPHTVFKIAAINRVAGSSHRKLLSPLSPSVQLICFVDAFVWTQSPSII